MLSGDRVGVHAKFRRVPLSGSRVVRELGSRVKSACRDGNGNGRQEEELAVDGEGKLLLRCAERDAQRVPSVLVWKKVISRGEMRERATFLWKRNLVRKIVIFWKLRDT